MKIRTITLALALAFLVAPAFSDTVRKRVTCNQAAAAAGACQERDIGKKVFQFGVLFTVPASDPSGGAGAARKDIQGVAAALGRALGVLQTCTADLQGAGVCPTTGEMFVPPVNCDQSAVDAGTCTEEQIGQQVPSPLSVPQAVDQAVDSWLKLAFQATVRQGRKAYRAEMAASVEDEVDEIR